MTMSSQFEAATWRRRAEVSEPLEVRPQSVQRRTASASRQHGSTRPSAIDEYDAPAPELRRIREHEEHPCGKLSSVAESADRDRERANDLALRRHRELLLQKRCHDRPRSQSIQAYACARPLALYRLAHPTANRDLGCGVYDRRSILAEQSRRTNCLLGVVREECPYGACGRIRGRCCCRVAGEDNDLGVR